jgi:hypothetical protein
MRRFISIPLVFSLFLSSHLACAEWENKEKTISAGSKTFYRFCSVCHGKDAQGDGLYASNLKASPTNLTLLSQRNNGIFPWIELYAIIDGNDLEEHGNREMPIWGEIFDISQWPNQYDGFSEVIVRGRIFELLVYLESIQVDASDAKK